MPAEKSESYAATAITFHWLMFLLVVCVGTLGLLHDSWPKTTQQFWINIHALLGLALWLVLLGRVAWRLRHPPPPALAGTGIMAQRLAALMHLALYALLLVIPIVGMVTFIYHGRILDLGLFKINLGVHSNRAIFHPTEEWHGYLAYTLFGLAGAHALVALWHQFVLRDGLLARMWPRSR